MNWETNEAERLILNNENAYTITRYLCLAIKDEYDLEKAVKEGFYYYVQNLFESYHPDKSVDEIDWVLLTDSLLATITEEINTK